MSPPTEKERRFANYLKSLADNEERAALADLRMGLGRPPEEAVRMYRYVVPWLAADARPIEEKAYYTVASLFASHQISWSGDSEWEANLGASFSRLAQKQREETGSEPAGVEDRFIGLLNSHSDDLPDHLRRAMALLKAREVPVDWAQLLHDIQRWQVTGSPVQRAWAKSFWGRKADPAAGTGAPDSEQPADKQPGD
jgi:CRISPR system Cascade subunit CasB